MVLISCVRYEALISHKHNTELFDPYFPLISVKWSIIKNRWMEDNDVLLGRVLVQTYEATGWHSLCQGQVNERFRRASFRYTPTTTYLVQLINFLNSTQLSLVSRHFAYGLWRVALAVMTCSRNIFNCITGSNSSYIYYLPTYYYGTDVSMG